MQHLADLTPWTGAVDPAITGVTCDSRKVTAGALYAALAGSKTDGRDFIQQALAAGAAAILAPDDRPIQADVPVVAVADARRAYALACAAFWGAQPKHTAAVTGTNGKTSAANFTRQIWTMLGRRAAALGTLGLIVDDRPARPSLTTPDPADLHRDLAELAEDGVTHACMEASSHGLDQRRLDGVTLQAAAFTNLTRDHLDYHPDMAAYLDAKLRLFRDLLPADGTAVINADSDAAEQVVKACAGKRVLSFGRQGTDLKLIDARPDPMGQVLDVEILGKARRLRLALAGTFQAANALTALGLTIACGEDPQAAADRLENLAEIPGRLQKAAVKNDAAIFVDYAHTPDALETVLNALRPHALNRLIAVFGCGGDRDPGKRPLMGEIAVRLADIAIVADDNPRSEDPELIRRAILAAAPGALDIGDRRAAIRHAIAMLQPGDVLLVAGKGHEQGQIVGGHVLPFDDVLECRLAAGGAA